MHHAAAAGMLASVQAIAALGGSVNVPNHCHATPVHAAASTGNLETLRLLVQLGAHSNALDAKGASPLHYAVERRQVRRRPRERGLRKAEAPARRRCGRMCVLGRGGVLSCQRF